MTDFVSMNRAAGDMLRTDILQLLRRDSFAVLELSEILGIAQPALSHHLKILLNAGLVAQRREGNKIFYRRALIAPQCPLADLMGGIFGTLDALPLCQALQKGIDRVYSSRSKISQNYFTTHAAEFRAHQARISIADVYAEGVADMITASRCMHRALLEVGPGSGDMLSLLAPRFDKVLAIDNSQAMLAQTREELKQAGIENVLLMLSDIDTLEDIQPVDAIVIGMVLHHLPSPDRFFQQARCMLNSGGVLVVVELCHHDQTWVQEACGDLWLGFEAEELDNWARAASFEIGQSQYLTQKNGFRIQIKSFHFFSGNIDPQAGD